MDFLTPVVMTSITSSQKVVLWTSCLIASTNEGIASLDPCGTPFHGAAPVHGLNALYYVSTGMTPSKLSTIEWVTSNMGVNHILTRGSWVYVFHNSLVLRKIGKEHNICAIDHGGLGEANHRLPQKDQNKS